MKKNKGITLVALIITIIVMLILVGVSVSVLINSDLIGTAQNAGDRTETAYGEEGNMGGIKVGDKYYDNIQDYIDGKGWTTIYEGTGPLTEGQILLSEDWIFYRLCKYKITIKSDEYNGDIVATPVWLGSSEEMEEYALAVISEGEAITFTSAEEVSGVKKGTIIKAVHTMNGSSLVVADIETHEVNTTCEITKVEEISTLDEAAKTLGAEGNNIYDGWMYLANNVQNELPITIDYTKEYGVIISINGELMYMPLQYSKVGDDELFMKQDQESRVLIGLFGENMIMAQDDGDSDVVCLYGIYEK